MPDRGEGAGVGEPGDSNGGVSPGTRRRETERSITPTADKHHGAESPHCQRPAPTRGPHGPQLRPQPSEPAAQRDRVLRAARPLAGSLHGEHLLGEPAPTIGTIEARSTVRSHALNPRVSNASHEQEEHHQHRWCSAVTSIGKSKLWTPTILPSLVSKMRPPIAREECNL